jgi:hypothetical protein
MKKNGHTVVAIESLITGTWKPITEADLKKQKHAVFCAFALSDGSTLYDTYRPPRRRNENPIQYYRRTKCVDDNFTHVHKGWYYCNPAHCQRRWRDRAERNEHLDQAYRVLGW